MPTRVNNILDRVYISDVSCYNKNKVIESVVKSDHSAVIVYNGDTLREKGQTTVVHSYRKKSLSQNSDFFALARTIDFKCSDLLDAQEKFWWFLC